jgi:hypothetical protein
MSGMSDLLIQIEEAAARLAPGNKELQLRLMGAIQREFADYWRQQDIDSHIRNAAASVANSARRAAFGYTPEK